MLKEEEATKEYNSEFQQVHKWFIFIVSLWQGLPMTHDGGLNEGLGMATVNHTDRRSPYNFLLADLLSPRHLCRTL